MLFLGCVKVKCIRTWGKYIIHYILSHTISTHSGAEFLDLLKLWGFYQNNSYSCITLNLLCRWCSCHLPHWKVATVAGEGSDVMNQLAGAIIWKFPWQMWLRARLWLTSLIYMPRSDTQAVAYGKKQEQERSDLLFALENKQANRS